MRPLRYLRQRMQRLRPYPALALVVAPLAVAEPLKLITLFVVGHGHWLVGLAVMICAYGVSLFVTHWVFRIVKPQLLELRWFAAFWNWLVGIWQKVSGWAKGMTPASTRASSQLRPHSTLRSSKTSPGGGGRRAAARRVG